MYQQEFIHRRIGGHSALALISSEINTLARYKAAIVTWTLVALVAVAAVLTQNYAQTLAPAGTSNALAPGLDSRAASQNAAGAAAPTAATPSPVASPAPGPRSAPAPSSAPVAAPAAPAAPVVPAPAPAPPAESAADSNTYTVVSGDTVGSIAARFGVDVNAMLAANGLSAYSVIVPGQVLKLTGPAVPVASPAPAPDPAPVPAVAPAAAPAPTVRTIYVAGSGGQAAVDSCIGPIHFTPTDAYSLFITEHDFCGGWARFSGIGVGETVNIVGYGTYTVTARGQVPQGGTTNNVAAVFGGFPRAILQTCIPGTNQMLVIGLN
ncbi:LysM peptidoglycan-binding domain-containing protein [Arthrobacter sp. NyZ413]|uniref:LysM peptidoglycan-binding domain-containing protein n=1 Tax=Arthrobacter sp. NyZ413 TaxID=3144669 RepID=UPI003BF80C9A